MEIEDDEDAQDVQNARDARDRAVWRRQGMAGGAQGGTRKRRRSGDDDADGPAPRRSKKRPRAEGPSVAAAASAEESDEEAGKDDDAAAAAIDEDGDEKEEENEEDPDADGDGGFADEQLALDAEAESRGSAAAALAALLDAAPGTPVGYDDWDTKSQRLRAVEPARRNAKGWDPSALAKDAVLTGSYWVHAPPEVLKGAKTPSARTAAVRAWAEAQPWFAGLRVQPHANACSPCAPRPFDLWTIAQSRGAVGVPRAFGLSTFGPPKLDARTRGDPMAPAARVMDASRPALPHQRDFVAALVAEERKSGTGFGVLDCGAGKCCGIDTPTMMFDGTFKPVQDVVVGDLLMGDDSTPRTVLSLARGREAMYRVTPTKGDAYVVNGSHILSLKHSTNHGRDRKGDLVDMSVRDFLALPPTFHGRAGRLLGYRVGVTFPPRPVPLDPYILGYWLGDGTTKAPQITTTEPEVLEYFKATLEPQGLRITPIVRDPITYYIAAAQAHSVPGSNVFKNALRELGVLGDKHIPHLYKANERAVQLQVLAGLIDSDGHCSRGTEFAITLKVERLLDDIIFLARSLGFAAYKKQVQKTCSNGANGPVTGTYYQTTIHGEGLEQIPVKLPRKRAAPRRQIKDALVTRISLEPLGEGDYYGFTLDGNHRYLLGDFTVTHNTRCALEAAAILGRKTLVLVDRSVLGDQWDAAARGAPKRWADTEAPVGKKAPHPSLEGVPSHDWLRVRCDAPTCRALTYASCAAADDEGRPRPLPADCSACGKNLDETHAAALRAKRAARLAKSGVPAWAAGDADEGDDDGDDDDEGALFAPVVDAVRGWLPGARVGHLVGKWMPDKKRRDPAARLARQADTVPSDVDDKDIVIASIQSVFKCGYPAALLARFGTVIVDEAHCIGARSLSQVLPFLTARYVIAISATPTRRDGLEHALYWLAGPTVYVYKRLPSITGVRDTVHVQRVLYHEGLREEITMGAAGGAGGGAAAGGGNGGKPAFSKMMTALARDEGRTAALVREGVALLRKRRKLLVITKLRRHARLLHGMIVKAARLPRYAAYALHGDSSKLARAAAKGRHTRVVCATAQLLGQGFDDDAIDAELLALPIGDPQQIIGRVERTKAGKNVPIVVDFIDTFGLFDAMQWKRARFCKSRGFKMLPVRDIGTRPVKEGEVDE